MRVPKPAAGMMTTTFIAGCKYTGWEEWVQMLRADARPLAEPAVIAGGHAVRRLASVGVPLVQQAPDRPSLKDTPPILMTRFRILLPRF